MSKGGVKNKGQVQEDRDKESKRMTLLIGLAREMDAVIETYKEVQALVLGAQLPDQTIETVNFKRIAEHQRQVAEKLMFLKARLRMSADLAEVLEEELHTSSVQLQMALDSKESGDLVAKLEGLFKKSE